MGTPKPLLDWFGISLVQSQIDMLLEAGVDTVFVVTGYRAYEVRESIKGGRVQAVVNPHYKEGKTTSIKAGLAALPGGTQTIVLLAVDQPRPAWLIKQVLESHIARKAIITGPRYDGHGGIRSQTSPKQTHNPTHSTNPSLITGVEYFRFVGYKWCFPPGHTCPYQKLHTY